MESTFKHVDQKLLVGRVAPRQVLNLVHRSSQVHLRELLRSLLHILNREVVRLQQLESVDVDLYQSSDLEISVSDVPLLLGVVVLLPLEELSSPDARVLISVLIDLDGIISTEK